MKRRPRPERSKDTWYVSFEPKARLPGQRGLMRTSETFRNEQEAKAFARTKLADSRNITAGTINPRLPKRTISSKQVLDWLNELEGGRHGHE
jgi:hypothetical protein